MVEGHFPMYLALAPALLYGSIIVVVVGGLVVR
jgi:hypothetical protein